MQNVSWRELFFRRGLVIERDRFEKMKDEFYELRGWDVATGLHTEKQLKALDLEDISEAMKERNLIAG